jgi:F0F1-type ATP synthase assembly protein I
MKRWQSALLVLGIGWLIAIAIIGGVLVGHWMDGKLGTSPVFLIIGILFGVAVAVYGVYATIKPFFGNNHNKGDS